MKSNTQSPAFAGFELPQYTQIPNLIIDHIMAELSGNEFKVLMYIARRTLGFHKPTDCISLSQIVNGVTTKSGTVLNKGTGLSKATVVRCAESLEVKGYLIRERQHSQSRGHLPTSYTLRFKGESTQAGPDIPLSQNETSPLVSNLDKPLSQIETHKRNSKQKKQQPVVVALLTERGLSEKLARRFSQEYEQSHIEQKVYYLDYLLNVHPKRVANPRGWLRRAIEEDYGPPDGYKTPAELEAEVATKQAQEEAENAQKRLFEQQEAQRLLEKEKEREALEKRLDTLIQQHDGDPAVLAKWRQVQTQMRLNFQTNTAVKTFIDDYHLIGVDDQKALFVVGHEVAAKILEHRLKQLVLNELRLAEFKVQEIEVLPLWR